MEFQRLDRGVPEGKGIRDHPSPNPQKGGSGEWGSILPRFSDFPRSNFGWGVVVVVLIALTAVPVGFAWAHGIHVVSETGKGPNQWMGPHKGELRGVGDYHLEFLVKDEKDEKKVAVYLYDIDMKPLSVEDKEGLLYLRFPGNVKKTLKLEPVVEKDNASHFEAKIDLGKANSFKAVVSLKIGKKRHNLRFSYSKEAQERGE